MTHPGWGAGDLFSIGVGLLVVATCLAYLPKHRTVPASTVVLASGMSIGPLLLIIADPFYQLAAAVVGVPGSLLEIVLDEGRATLWWAAVVAALYVIRDLL